MSCSYLTVIQHRHPIRIPESISFVMLMGSRPLRSYASALPRYFLVEFGALQPLASHPQQIAIAKAEQLDDTLEYFLDKQDVLEVASNAIVLVDAIVQMSHLRVAARCSRRAASPSSRDCLCYAVACRTSIGAITRRAPRHRARAAEACCAPQQLQRPISAVCR